MVVDVETPWAGAREALPAELGTPWAGAREAVAPEVAGAAAMVDHVQSGSQHHGNTLRSVERSYTVGLGQTLGPLVKGCAH